MDRATDFFVNNWKKILLWNAGIALTAFISTTIVYTTYKLLTTPETPNHCYVKYSQTLVNCSDPESSKPFKLHAYVPWSSDRKLGAFATFEEAVGSAYMIDCPLKAK